MLDFNYPYKNKIILKSLFGSENAKIPCDIVMYVINIIFNASHYTTPRHDVIW